MPELMSPADFEKMFMAALTDKSLQIDMRRRGFRALDERGFNHGVPPDMQRALERAIFVQKVGRAKPKPKCGVCGVCGACGLCGGANFGSASAALWALFALGATGASPAL